MTRTVRSVAIAILGVVAFAGGAAAQQKRAITFEDLISMHRLAELVISPDGKWAAYSVGTPDLGANRVAHDIWQVPVAGGEALRAQEAILGSPVASFPRSTWASFQLTE